MPRQSPAAPRTLVDAFDRQAARTPEAIAVTGEDGRLTYAELRGRAEHLAAVLVAEGVSPETVVPMLADRSVELVVAILAVVKAGGAYLPIHLAQPVARMRAVATTTACPVLLVGATYEDHELVTELRAAGRRIVLAQRPAAPVDPSVALPRARSDQLAYVMFTSGSTGEPKGIAITHGGVVDLATDPCWDMRPGDRVLLHSPHAFDASTWEIWGPLLAGGRVVVAPADTPAAAALRDLVTGGGVNRLSLTAGLFRVVAEDWVEALAGLTEVTTGGDVISAAAVTRVLKHCPGITVRTTYGPTEITLCATEQPWRAGDDPGSTVPLGRPMRGTRLHVLDEALRTVPAGVAGELWIAGTGLARGYAGQPGLTAARFVADPSGPPGTRMYRTGDIVRVGGDDELTFLGRADDQVKVNGFRVELGDVESTLAACPGVRHAVVVPHEHAAGDKRLLAYYVATGEVDPARLRRSVADQLPEYMVPADFIELAALPITPNGKVDRTELPAPTGPTPHTARHDVMCQVFAEVLGVAEVHVDDDFFDLGGHPYLATTLVTRLRTALGADIDVQTLLDNPTVALLERRLGTG